MTSARNSASHSVYGPHERKREERVFGVLLPCRYLSMHRWLTADSTQHRHTSHTNICTQNRLSALSSSTRWSCRVTIFLSLFNNVNNYLPLLPSTTGGKVRRECPGGQRQERGWLQGGQIRRDASQSSTYCLYVLYVT